LPRQLLQGGTPHCNFKYNCTFSVNCGFIQGKMYSFFGKR
jgi:hypothetical protein